MVEIDREGRHSTTAISAFELFYGAYKSNQRLTKVEKTKAILESRCLALRIGFLGTSWRDSRRTVGSR
jgi:hypothetical protein